MIQRKPTRRTYTIRRIKFTLAVIGFVATVTALLTWQRPDAGPALWILAGVYLTTAIWLTVRFMPKDEEHGGRRPRIVTGTARGADMEERRCSNG